jgi:hypothetical protein
MIDQSFLGAPGLALEHYRGLSLKQIQHDTLSHFLLSRASSFSLAATGDLTYSSECTESSQIYIANSTEVIFFVSRRIGTYSNFHRLRNSLSELLRLRNIPRYFWMSTLEALSNKIFKDIRIYRIRRPFGQLITARLGQDGARPHAHCP